MEKYNEYQLTKMPWGKYRGYYVKDIPTDYIKWCIQNYTDLGMATMMSTELQRRDPKLRKIKS